MSPDTAKIRKDLVEALGKSSLLQFLREHSDDHRALRSMLETSNVRVFGAGQTIIHEGESSDCMYFVADGRVEVSVDGKPVCTLGRVGDVFGEMGLITGRPRSATITALTNATCLVTSKAFAARLDKRENLMFRNLMQQALTRVLMGRLNVTNRELGTAKKDLVEARAELDVLKMVSEEQEAEIEDLKKRQKGRFLGPRGDADT